MLPAATRTMAEVAAAQNLPHLETEHFEALTLEDIQQKNAGLAGGFHGKMIYKWRFSWENSYGKWSDLMDIAMGNP